MLHPPNHSTPQPEPWLTTLTGYRVRIQTRGAATAQRIAIIEYEEPPHTRPPVFTRHEFVEVFCVVSGAFTFKFLGEETFLAPTGSVVSAPSWKQHSFWNAGDTPARALLVCSPA